MGAEEGVGEVLGHGHGGGLAGAGGEGGCHGCGLLVVDVVVVFVRYEGVLLKSVMASVLGMRRGEA